MSTEPNNHPAGGSPGAYEHSDANPVNLVRFAIGLAVLLVVVWWGMKEIFDYFGRVQQKDLGVAVTPYEQERPLPPLPRLQVEPVEDLEQVREHQKSALESPPGWVDRANGLVHIPISRAMDLVLEHGALPIRPNAPPAPDRPAAPTVKQPASPEPHATSGGGIR